MNWFLSPPVVRISHSEPQLRLSTVPDKEQASQGSQYNKIQAGGAKHAAKVPMVLLFLSFSSLLRKPVQPK